MSLSNKVKCLSERSVTDQEPDQWWLEDDAIYT
jgi:hypothetical protein